MIAKYNDDPLMLLYLHLKALIYKTNKGTDDEVDDIIRSALEYNGCAFSDNVSSTTIQLTEDKYLYFIYGVKGNKFSEIYDYINIYGTSYIIIFMDYYKTIKTEIKDTYSLNIEDNLNNIMGNSIYFNAICEIVNFIIKLLSTIKPPIGSIQEKINSIAPTIIAANIINDIRPIQEEDCDGAIIPYNRIIELLNTNINMILIGIF